MGVNLRVLALLLCHGDPLSFLLYGLDWAATHSQRPLEMMEIVFGPVYIPSIPPSVGGGLTQGIVS